MVHIKSHGNRLGTITTTLLVLVIFIGLPKAGEARSKKIIYSFTFNSDDGNSPAAGLVSDSAGVLYGTTQGGGAFFQGAIFALSPPTVPGGLWTENIIYSFTGGADGGEPLAPLLLGKNGVLYGTASTGGNGCPSSCGVVFALNPPSGPGGSWSESVIHAFEGGTDGSSPFSGLVADKNGVLYGTTGALQGNGPFDTVFSLTPPGSANGPWKETVVYVFPGQAQPRGRLLIGKGGTLYGTTSNGLGTAYSLAPPQKLGGTWTATTLHSFFSSIEDGFVPLAGLTAGKNGVLYGTTSQGGLDDSGVVYSLTPPVSPSGVWTESIIHSFRAGVDGFMPAGEVVLSRNGSILGTTVGASYSDGLAQGFDGTLYALQPPATPDGGWNETILSFKGSPNDGANPFGALLIGKNGGLYGTTAAGGEEGSGTIFEINP